MAWFSGTSTGDRYTVGQTYSNGNGSYTANADGTFTNQRSGSKLVGSSEAPGVQWGGYESIAGGGGASLWSNDPLWQGNGGSQSDGGSGSGSAHVASRGGSVTSGPGNGAVAAARGSSLTIGPGAPSGGVVFGGPKKTTELWFGGMNVHTDKSTSDVQDFEDRLGEGDFLSPTWFYSWGVAGRDAYTGVIKHQKLESDLATVPGAAASGAVDFARHLDERKRQVLLQDRRENEFMWADPTRMYKQWGQYPDPYR